MNVHCPEKQALLYNGEMKATFIERMCGFMMVSLSKNK